MPSWEYTPAKQGPNGLDSPGANIRKQAFQEVGMKRQHTPRSM